MTHGCFSLFWSTIRAVWRLSQIVGSGRWLYRLHFAPLSFKQAVRNRLNLRNCSFIFLKTKEKMMTPRKYKITLDQLRMAAVRVCLTCGYSKLTCTKGQIQDSWSKSLRRTLWTSSSGPGSRRLQHSSCVEVHSSTRQVYGREQGRSPQRKEISHVLSKQVSRSKEEQDKVTSIFHPSHTDRRRESEQLRRQFPCSFLFCKNKKVRVRRRSIW